MEWLEYKKQESPYCDICGSCGEALCCSPLNCAYANMVIHPHPDCKYGDTNYLAIEFAYKMAKELYEKYEDPEMFDRIWCEVYDEEK